MIDAPAGMNGLLSDYAALLQGKSFSSMGEVNKEVDRITRAKNALSIDDFCGLSPEQMNFLLYSPFEWGQLITINEDCTEFSDTPILRLFMLIIYGIGTDGLKATVTGNLPRDFCREAARAFYSDEKYKNRTRYGQVNSEMDFEDLNTVRIIADIAGFIRKTKGRFRLTKKGLVVFKNGLNGKIFKELLVTYTRKFNWGYRDRYPDIQIIQMSGMFTLHILQKYGGDFRSTAYYEDLFIKAFPMTIREVGVSVVGTAEEEVRRCYSLRALERFAAFFGLAELKQLTSETFRRRYEIRKTQLLDNLIRFNVYPGKHEH